MTQDRAAILPNRNLADPMALMPTETRGALVPQSMGEAFECAKIMATGRFSVPGFLKGNPGDCLRIIMIATRTALDPFMLANRAYLTKSRSGEERMEFEAQAVHAIVSASGYLDGPFDLEFTGKGEDLACTITGHIGGRAKRKTYRLRGITTRNSPLWKTDPEQQLGYYAERSWCRLYAPHAMMGLVAREDPPLDITPEAVTINGDGQDARAKVEAALGIGAEPADDQPEMDLGGAPEPEGVPLYDLDGQEVNTYTDALRWFGALQTEIANEARDRDPALCEDWIKRNEDGAQMWIASGQERAPALWEQCKNDALEAALAAGANA